MAGRSTRANPKTVAKDSSSSRPAPARRNVKADKSPPKSKPEPKKTPVTRSSPRKGGIEHHDDEDEPKTAAKKAPTGEQILATNSKPGAAPEKSTTNHVSASAKSSTSHSATTATRKPHDTSNLSLKEERSPSPSKQNRAQSQESKLKQAPVVSLSRKEVDREKRKFNAELNRGSSIVAQMPEKDMETFMERLGSHCSQTDTKSHLSRATIMKWDAIAFGSYSAEDLRAAWRFLRSCTRTYRIMSELVQEVRLTYSNTQFKLKLLDALPGFPQSKRFGSAFHTYLKEKWDTRTEQEKIKFPTYLIFQVEHKKVFDSMSLIEKQHWEQESTKIRAAHEVQVEAYFRQHPEFAEFKKIYENLKSDESQPKKKKKSSSDGSRGPREPRAKTSKESMEADYPDAPVLPMNPQALFINSRLKKLDPAELEGNITEHKLRYSQKWNNLSDKKKAKWIGKCINKCEEYRKELLEYQASHPGYRPAPFKFLQKVNRAEVGIWETVRGRPTRPPFTVIELFQRKLLEKDKYKKLTPTQLKEIADAKFNELSTNDREMYRINFKQMVLMYRREIEEFYNGVPDVVKPSVFSTIPKKFQDGLKLPGDDKNGPEPSEAGDDDEKEGFTTILSHVPSSPPLTPVPMSTSPTPGKKRPISAEFVEDSSSSNEAARPSKKKKKTTPNNLAADHLEYRLTLPDIHSSSPPRLLKAQVKPERSPSPEKKKKKHERHSAENESEESEHVFGIPSVLSNVQPDASAADHKKKNKKQVRPVEYVEEPEIQITYHSKGDDFEVEDDEDEEESDEDEGYGYGHRLPPFPADDYGHFGPEISGSSEDSSSDDRDRKKKTMTAAARTSKEYRDRQVEKYQRKLSR